MKDRFKKVGSFLADKGFYIVLVLCICVIGVSAYQIMKITNESTQTAAQVELEVESNNSLDAPQENQIPFESEEDFSEPDETLVEEEDSVEEPAEETVEIGLDEALLSEHDSVVADSYIWPVNGTVIADFSLEVQAFDDTMGDWRTHDGIDIAGALGAEVRAAGNGTVIGVYEDDLMGTSVVIDHGNGVTSLYANLAGEPTVSEGDTVTAGDIIGAIGQTAIAESSKEAHLHFQMSVDGVTVDPENYLP